MDNVCNIYQHCHITCISNLCCKRLNMSYKRLNVSYKRQELLTLRDHLGLPSVFSWVRLLACFSFLCNVVCFACLRLVSCVTNVVSFFWIYRLFLVDPSVFSNVYMKKVRNCAIYPRFRIPRLSQILQSCNIPGVRFYISYL